MPPMPAPKTTAARVGSSSFHVDAGLGHGLVSGNDGVLDEALEAARLLLGQPVLGRRRSHAPRPPRAPRNRFVIEARDGIDAAARAHDGVPQRVNTDAGGRDRAHAGDDHAVGAVRTARCGRSSITSTHSAITSINADDLPGNIAGLLACQEAHQMRNVVRPCRSACMAMLLADGLALLLGQRVGHVGGDEAGGDGVGRDAAGCKLAGDATSSAR